MDSMHDIDDYLEPEEINKILSITISERDFLMINMLWHTGMRISELINLQPQSIDFDNGFINIKWGKGDRSRRIPLNQQFGWRLKLFINARKIKPEEKIFDITRQRCFQIIKKQAALAGYNNVHPHTFRHSFAINCIHNNIDISYLKKWLGHSSLSTTEIYLQFKDKDHKEVYNTMKF